MQLYPSTLLKNRYEIIKVIAPSQIATVYLALDREHNTTVAVKALPKEVDARGDFSKRFRSEAKILNELKDPPFARILDFGVEEKFLFIVMEYVPGKTLDQILAERGVFDQFEALGIVGQVAQGLQVTYQRGIVHRDIKPQNIMLLPNNTIKILDFGIAVDVSKITHIDLSGAPAYQSPEQVESASAAPDIRWDIWALGAVFYEMLTGKPPFTGTSLLQVVKAIVMDPYVPVRRYREDVVPEIEDIISRCLQKDPRKRYQTPLDLYRATQSKGVSGDPVLSLYAQAEEAFANQDWAKAAALAKRVLERKPNHKDAEELAHKAERREQERLKEYYARVYQQALDTFNEGNQERATALCNEILHWDPQQAEAKALLKKMAPRQPVLVTPSGRRFQLKRKVYRLGRTDARTKQTPDIDLGSEELGRTVSRSHGRLVQNGSGWDFELDTETQNETLVNGEAVRHGQRIGLKEGDVIQLGAVKLTFTLQSAD